MVNSYDTSGSLRRRIAAVKSIVLLAAFFLSGRPAIGATSVYIFDPNLSTATKVGGFAGVRETYSIDGRLKLSVEDNTAVFEKVDAALTDETGSVYAQSLDEVFNMTALSGDPNSLNTIVFKGTTADGTDSDVTIFLTFEDGLAHLTGGTTPPPNSADLFFYELDAVATRKYGGGTGEPNDPYEIHTAEQMNAIGAEPSDWDRHFKLMADIDLSGFKGADYNIIGGWQSISFNRPFSGVFNGNDHAISNFSYSSPDASYVGLFGYVAGQADQEVIKNLRIIDPNVDAETGNGVGSLVGWLRNGTVTACSVEGGIVSGSIAVGGLVGTHGPKSESATFPVPGPYPPPYTISRCCSTAVVLGRVSVGGLVGSNSGLVTDCYSAGPVSGDIQVGGLVGANYRCTDGQCFSGSVHDSYSISVVTGDYSVGGLVGDGFPDEVINSFWDTEASGLRTSAGGIGQTTAEMQTAGTFLDAGWDFAGESANGIEDIWRLCEGTNYPRFVWQIPVGDFVCPDGIAIDDFLFFLDHWLDDNCDVTNAYCQGTDFDLSGAVDQADLEILVDSWLSNVSN